jgi:hydroxypyruvate isomerase
MRLVKSPSNSPAIIPRGHIPLGAGDGPMYRARMQRRDFLKHMAAAPLAASLASAPAAARGQAAASQTPAPTRAPIRQSVMSSVWGNSGLSFEERCKVLQRIGFKAVDLPSAQQVPILRDHGLVPALMTGTGTSFQNGLVRRELHDKIEAATRQGIDMCVEVGCPNLIALPGERRGMSREEGMANAIAILSRVAPYAEEKGVVLCMEITNSKVEADQRTDQMFDRLDWGWNVCRGTGSPNVKIVYDIYHVQIADGDVTRNLRDNIDLICHIHTAGVPDRTEIDDTNELNYRFIANAIADLGFTGYVAHEHRPGPGRDAIQSLEECFEILNV